MEDSGLGSIKDLDLQVKDLGPFRTLGCLNQTRGYGSGSEFTG